MDRLRRATLVPLIVFSAGVFYLLYGANSGSSPRPIRTDPAHPSHESPHDSATAKAPRANEPLYPLAPSQPLSSLDTAVLDFERILSNSLTLGKPIEIQPVAPQTQGSQKTQPPSANDKSADAVKETDTARVRQLPLSGDNGPGPALNRPILIRNNLLSERPAQTRPENRQSVEKTENKETEELPPPTPHQSNVAAEDISLESSWDDTKKKDPLDVMSLPRRVFSSQQLPSGTQSSDMEFKPLPTFRHKPDAPAALKAGNRSDPLPITQPPLVLTAKLPASVIQRAEKHLQYGSSLARRGALLSAQDEFQQALFLIAQALDAQHNSHEHTRQLARALQALEEADDFARTRSSDLIHLDAKRIAKRHKTPVIREDRREKITPVEALQAYYAYAQHHLTLACAHQPAASRVLFHLGKLHSLGTEESSPSRRLNGPKSILMHQTALAVDRKNVRSANELGFQLAQHGQLPKAKEILLHSLTVSPQAEAWHNLSMVHQRLGEQPLAQLAKQEWRVAKQREYRVPNRQGHFQTGPITWIQPGRFGREFDQAPDQLPVKPRIANHEDNKNNHVGPQWWEIWKWL